ncbi:MAG: cysteine desulfurase [Planctomycetota bacterium]|nr:cysteine desulfurase [Planctomycetota bacterium]
MREDSPENWNPESIRADFPILSTYVHTNKPLVYLDNAATTQHPRQVIQAMVDVYERHYANVHRGIHSLSDQSTDLYETARDIVRDFIGAQHRHEIIFTSGTTASINLVARSWGDRFVASGDEILLTEMEHHANLVPWQQLAERVGCQLRFIPIQDDGQLDLSQLPSLLSDRTRLLAVTAMSNVLGTINPIGQLVRAAHASGAKVLIDAAQSVPQQTTNVQEWDADFVAFSGHKMLGPTGIGVLYGRESLLEAMPPFLGGGSMIRRVRWDGYEPADLPARFEAGTPPIVPAIGLGAAIQYLTKIGLKSIHEHERSLVEAAHTLLADIGGIRFLGPEPEKKGGIVSFTLDGIHPHDIAQILDRDGIAIRAGHHCAMPLHQKLQLNASNRASFYLYNTIHEVEQLAESLRRVKSVFRRG